MKLSDIILEENNQVAATAKAINSAITQIDDSMHYGIFAKAVAKVLKDEYGSHNFKPFVDELTTALKQKDLSELDTSHEYSEQEKEIKDLVAKASGVEDVRVIMSAPSDLELKREKGRGTIRFFIQDTVDPTAFEQVLNVLKAKGYTITKDSNFYDTEPGERTWYPTIDFEFEI